MHMWEHLRREGPVLLTMRFQAPRRGPRRHIAQASGESQLPAGSAAGLASAEWPARLGAARRRGKPTSPHQLGDRIPCRRRPGLGGRHRGRWLCAHFQQGARRALHARQRCLRGVPPAVHRRAKHPQRDWQHRRNLRVRAASGHIRLGRHRHMEASVRQDQRQEQICQCLDFGRKRRCGSAIATRRDRRWRHPMTTVGSSQALSSGHCAH
mmetsp:Transcript_55034/g.108687  ORF Transcript_55034/g.108687 Transcript_55034/m.108687 type:complete len:210 (-) Transcript_55034:6-635(-)